MAMDEKYGKKGNMMKGSPGYQDLTMKSKSRNMAGNVGKSGGSGKGHNPMTRRISKHPLSGGPGIWTDKGIGKQGHY